MNTTDEDPVVAALISSVEEVTGNRVGAKDVQLTVDELDLDSLALIEVGMLMEEALDAEFDIEEFRGVETFGEAANLFTAIYRRSAE